MKINFTKEDYSFLSAIGLNFKVKPNFKIQPELGIIQILNRDEFIGNDVYGMLKLFLESYHEFIRVDILATYEKSLPPMGRATLSALAIYCEKELKDKRFKKLKKYFLKSQQLLNSEVVSGSITLRANQWTLKNNIWFKNRLIFGLGVRADAFSALKSNQIKTYYELSKFIGSSLFAARKNYLDFNRIQEIERF